MMSCDFHFNLNDATFLPSNDGAIVEIQVVAPAGPLVAITADPAAVSTVWAITILGTSLTVARRGICHPAVAST
jgi:hypothetical protein